MAQGDNRNDNRRGGQPQGGQGKGGYPPRTSNERRNDNGRPKQRDGSEKKRGQVSSTLPLYRDLLASWGDGKMPLLASDGHHGLYWERFFHGYAPDCLKVCDGDTRNRIPPGKTRFIQGFDKRDTGNKNAIEQASARMAALVSHLGGAYFDAQNDWHFATGMGQEHPTENGFAFHRTLGTPFLPGSGVKGLVRGYLEWLGADGGDQTAHRDRLWRWFGSEDKEPGQQKNDNQAGWYIFFDAIPTGQIRLRADVMTPHYGKWYEKGGTAEAATPDVVPADWHSPQPIPFLVADKPSLRFSVAVRTGLGDEAARQAAAELPELVLILKEALSHFGAGAKTSAGYGRFDVREA